MRTLTIPLSGHLLVAHLAAYGLGFLLDAGGEDAFVGHDPLSLEMEPHVLTNATVDRATQLVRESAVECESAVEADLQPGQSGNARQPVIWARATALSRAAPALSRRETVLDTAERENAGVAVALIAGLGAPAAWSGDRPQRGATQLDGVMGNYTSDFVRGVLRRARPEAAAAHVGLLEQAWMGAAEQAATYDKTLWSPPRSRVDLVHQWLAALGLSLLPVAQHTRNPAVTPCWWRDREGSGVTLPVLETPASVPRMRSLLQLPELLAPNARVLAPAAARLRALGIRELVSFSRVDQPGKQSVTFNFARGRRVDL